MSEQYPKVQFVAAPAVGATVRLDLNDDTAVAGVRTWVRSDGWSLGVPTLTGDVDGIGVEYGPRRLAFTQAVDGSKAFALVKHAALARELLRDRNWLLFQLSAETDPIWFRTYRTQPGELSFDQVTSNGPLDRWRIGMNLDAEPWAYGARVTQPVVTVNNDPAAGTNPMGYLLPAIQGDAPAPLRIAADFNSDLGRHDILWTVTPVPDDYEPIVWPIGTGDSFTAGTDTGAGTSNSTYTGGTYRAVSFSSEEDLVTRLYGPVPDPVPPGRYRVFLRVARSDGDSTFSLRLGSHDTVYGDDFTGSATVTMNRGAGVDIDGYAAYVDLGVRAFPSHLTTIDIDGVADTPQIALQVGLLSGTGDAYLDALVLVPVEIKGIDEPATALLSEFVDRGPLASDTYSVWDGDEEAFTRVNDDGIVDSSIQPYNKGQFPIGRPGVANALHLIQQTRGAAGPVDANDPDDITDTAAVTISYHPRHLWIGDR